MKVTGNTILITGGGSGIGAALAEAFHSAGNKVVIAGRRKERLEKVTGRNPGMEYLAIDQAKPEDTAKLADVVSKRFPDLNVLVNNAGIQYVEDLTGSDTTHAEETFQVNLLGPVRLTSALVGQLLHQPHSAILNVSSTLAMVPSAMMPSYCASKAAMHSYTQSLRFQLRNTSVQVIEIIPPWVQTELQGPERGMNPKAMPLDAFIAETMALLREQPEAGEILVDRAKPMRFAEQGDHEGFFARYNQGWSASQTK